MLLLLTLLCSQLALLKAGSSHCIECQQFRKYLQIPTENVYCDLKEYEELEFVDFNGEIVKGWNFGNKNCEEETSSLLAVVRPGSTGEVSEVVKVARNLGIPVSVRSGGHSYTCNSIKPGSIHLDMRSLNNIQVLDNTIDDSPLHEERKLIKTGTGNTFAQLLKATSGETLSFVHAEGLSVGVGGFYLHGGSHAGALTEKYGLGNESIRALEMVTADGSVLTFTEKRSRRPVQGYMDYYRDPVQVTKDGVTVSAKHYSDLWDAMRVAGSSYGVVTSLTIQTFATHQPPVFFLIMYPSFSEEDQLQLFMDAAEDDAVTVNLIHVLGARDPGIHISMTEGEAEEALAEGECLEWLDRWMKARGYSDWKSSKWDKNLTAITKSQLVGHDAGSFYPKSRDWASSTIQIRSDDPARVGIMRFYKSRYLQADGLKDNCWLMFQHWDIRATTGHRQLYVDFTCAGEGKEIVRQTEVDLYSQFPGLSFTKYYNVPILLRNDTIEDKMRTRYFPEYQALSNTKSIFDPEGIFDQTQGIQGIQGIHDEL